MHTRISINGVTYDSVEAMPPDVRKMYEQTLSLLPELADRDGDGIPDAVQGNGLTVRHKVDKKFIVNGKSYDSLESMPADIRQTCEQAMSAAQGGVPTVKKNEIKLSFQLTGPRFSIRRTSGNTGRSTPVIPNTSDTEQPVVRMSSNPIEPSSTEGGIRLALIAGGCGIIGFLFWLLTRAR